MLVSTSFDRYRRHMDVETTLCAYWELKKEGSYFSIYILRNS